MIWYDIIYEMIWYDMMSHGMLHGTWVGEDKAGAWKLLFFPVLPCQVAAAGDDKYLSCVAGAAAIVLCIFGSSSVFSNEWVFMCA